MVAPFPPFFVIFRPLCCAHTTTNKNHQALLHIAGCYVYDRHVTPDCLPIRCPDQPPRSPAEMKTAEEVFRVLDLYLWLANDRLGSPGVFKDRREVEEQRQQVAGLIDVALQRMGGVAHLA